MPDAPQSPHPQYQSQALKRWQRWAMHWRSQFEQQRLSIQNSLTTGCKLLFLPFYVSFQAGQWARLVLSEQQRRPGLDSEAASGTQPPLAQLSHTETISPTAPITPTPPIPTTTQTEKPTTLQSVYRWLQRRFLPAKHDRSSLDCRPSLESEAKSIPHLLLPQSDVRSIPNRASRQATRIAKSAMFKSMYEWLQRRRPMQLEHIISQRLPAFLGERQPRSHASPSLSEIVDHQQPSSLLRSGSNQPLISTLKDWSQRLFGQWLPPIPPLSPAELRSSHVQLQLHNTQTHLTTTRIANTRIATQANVKQPMSHVSVPSQPLQEWELFIPEPHLKPVSSSLEQANLEGLHLDLPFAIVAKATPKPTHEQPITYSPSNDSHLSQTWIDVPSLTVGYDRHPFEQVLLWLDRLLCWLENLWETIKQKLRHESPV